MEALDNTLDSAASKQLTYPEMLEQLLGAEVEARRERYLSTRIKMAHFPFQCTLKQFDFSFQPSIDERQVKELANHNLDRRLRVYLAPKVLVVDEFGIWPYDREAATAIFTLDSARHERGRIILTSNKGFGE